jgi:hypothetical protein
LCLLAAREDVLTGGIKLPAPTKSSELSAVRASGATLEALFSLIAAFCRATQTLSHRGEQGNWSGRWESKPQGFFHELELLEKLSLTFAASAPRKIR